MQKLCAKISDMQANGFSAVADPPPLSISEDNIAPYSLPQEAFNFQPDDLALISKFAGGDQERKIHCNIELRPDEVDRLKLLQDEARKRSRSYYVSITVMATRYISYARGNPDKAIAMMDETQKWRTEYFGSGPLTDSKLIDDLSHGVLYFTGRDFAMRPILVIRACRLPDAWHKDGSGVTRLIRMLVFCMEYLVKYMFVPGKVENLVVLVDLKNLGIADVPIKALKSIYSVLSHHYIVRVFRFYVVNMSYMLGTLVGVVKPILTDRQRQKLNFVKNVNECKDWVALHHLEEDLGGSRPKITTFFPFPLLPGPFAPGSSAGPRKDAVKNCHTALTAEGFRGLLWDTSKTKAENIQYEYTDVAEGIFKACGLPIPANCPVKPKEFEPAEVPARKEEQAALRKKIIVSLDDPPSCGDGPQDAMHESASQGQSEAQESLAVNASDCGSPPESESPARAKTAATGFGSLDCQNGDAIQIEEKNGKDNTREDKNGTKTTSQKKCCAIM